MDNERCVGMNVRLIGIGAVLLIVGGARLLIMSYFSTVIYWVYILVAIMIFGLSLILLGLNQEND